MVINLLIIDCYCMQITCIGEEYLISYNCARYLFKKQLHNSPQKKHVNINIQCDSLTFKHEITTNRLTLQYAAHGQFKEFPYENNKITLVSITIVMLVSDFSFLFCCILPEYKNMAKVNKQILHSNCIQRLKISLVKVFFFYFSK